MPWVIAGPDRDSNGSTNPEALLHRVPARPGTSTVGDLDPFELHRWSRPCSAMAWAIAGPRQATANGSTIARPRARSAVPATQSMASSVHRIPATPTADGGTRNERRPSWRQRSIPFAFRCPWPGRYYRTRRQVPEAAGTIAICGQDFMRSVNHSSTASAHPAPAQWSMRPWSPRFRFVRAGWSPRVAWTIRAKG
jgi:hypothetical protein